LIGDNTCNSSIGLINGIYHALIITINAARLVEAKTKVIGQQLAILNALKTIETEFYQLIVKAVRETPLPALYHQQRIF